MIAVKINGDSSAIQGILARRGCGAIKHLEVKQLWLQEQVRRGKVDVQKSHCTKEDAQKHLKHMCFE